MSPRHEGPVPGVAARCRHFGVCGGCDWQDIPYERQLDLKRQQVRERVIGAVGRLEHDVQPTIGMPVAGDGMPWQFRQKAAFVFAADPRNPRRLLLGHYARGSRRVIPIEECPVHTDRANALAFALRAHFERAGVRAAGRAPGGVLRHVVIRTSRDGRQAVAMVVVTHNDRVLRAPLTAFVSAEQPTGLLVNVNDRPGSLMVGPRTIRVAGREHVREDGLPASFLVSPAAFFQTNVAAAAHLVSHVLGEAASTVGDAPGPVGRTPPAALDLYAGSGLFSLPLAAKGFDVTAVEENARAIRDGQANQRLNAIAPARLRFVRARVEDVLPRMRRLQPRLVVLDPPRQGCPPAVIRGVFADIAPPRAIYVSCDLTALARELPSIVDAGYRITRVQPIDMFPHTTHVETVVTLVR